MAFKLSPALDDQMESGVHTSPGIVFGERYVQQLFSALVPFENAILSLGDYPLQHKSAEGHEPENYQVALIPFRKTANREKNPPALLEMESVLVLPLTWKELIGGLRAAVGPSVSGRQGPKVRFGDVCIDFLSREVSRLDENVVLTPMEFNLLKFLVKNAGRAISRDEMLNEVWGYENYPCTRTVDNHILKLRQKLEVDPANPVHFQTVHGVGYKLVLTAGRDVAEHKM